MKHLRYLLACGLLSGAVAVASAQEPGEAVSLRIDGVHEILKGSLANPFGIGLSPNGTIALDKPVYVVAAFRPATNDKKAIKDRDRRKVREVLDADRVVIDVLFPHLDPAQKPIAVQGWLRPDFCCGKGLDGTFPIPEKARRGEVTLRVSWPTSGSLKSGSTLLDVVIGP